MPIHPVVRHVPAPRFGQDLPILSHRAEVEAAVRGSPVVIVCGETGSGKTTQLPQICLAAGRGRQRVIGHTQPRRIAARSVAARIAAELGVPVGGAVGVKVRFADRTGPETAIKLMTDGILLAETQGDPEFLAYDTIIIDEAHERSLNIDFLLGYLRRLVPRRPDLRVVVTSATIDPARFAAFFEAGGVPRPPVINVSGRTYPVEVRHRPAPRESDQGQVDPDEVADVADGLIRAGKGDVLVFVPGEREIRLCGDALRRARVDADVLPLFARLTADEQDAVFRWKPGGRARVIVATNVAETSLTVPGIRSVIDTGLVRMLRYDPSAKVRRLPIEMVSRASADQRSGRCGRLGPGVCVRLFDDAALRDRFTQPEILRTDLASVVLRMLALRLGRIEDFPFLDPPGAGAIRDGLETLFELGATSRRPQEGEPMITGVGERLSRLPLEPRVARMILAGDAEGCLPAITVLASALSIQDPRDRPAAAQDAADRAHAVFRHETSDFITLLNIWDQYEHASEALGARDLREWCREHFISHVRMREWWDTWRQVRDASEDLDLDPGRGGWLIPPDAAAEARLHRALITGLIANVCCKDESIGAYEYRGYRGNEVSIHPSSVLFKKNPRWFVAAEIVQTTRLYARTLARIDPAWVEELAGHVMQRVVTDRHFDATEGRAVAWERLSFAGIVVVPRRKVALAAIDPAEARSLLIRDGLATGRFRVGDGSTPQPEFVAHNARVFAQAASVEGKLRRRGVILPPERIAEWLDRVVPGSVVDGASLADFAADATNARSLCMPLSGVLDESAGAAADPTNFPDELRVGDRDCPLEYRLEPGKETDGITAVVPLLSLPALSTERAAWLVPGWLAEKIAALLKTLPRALRAKLEQRGTLPDLAKDLAEVVSFGEGPLGGALSEAARVLWNTDIPETAWALDGVPAHLRLRVRVADDEQRTIAEGRDISALQQQLTGRIAKARATAARSAFDRARVLAWDFGELPASVPTESGQMHPALVDETSHVRLTLVEDPVRAQALTSLGVRRLFEIACREELAHRLRAVPTWGDLCTWYAALGKPDRLSADLGALVCERCFLWGQPLPLNRDEFDERLELHWGRLAQGTIEVAGVAGALLESRYRVAQRLSGGTPRLWANSVADIREQAAYLMPEGFLGCLPWERVREYPRYARAMRQRLFALREDGAGSEAAALASIQPHWKRFTGWVARRMGDERARDATPPATTASRAPLPKARRAAPTVNLDAGAWAMRPGALPAPVLAYRWAIEDFRVTNFAPEMGGAQVTPAILNALWSGVA